MGNYFDQFDAPKADANYFDQFDAPKPSFGRQVLNAAGDAASAVGDFAGRATDYRKTQEAKGFGGLAGMPRAAADAVSWGADKVGVSPGILAGLPYIGAIGAGKYLPTGEQASNWMLDRAKANPDFKERTINPVVDAGVQALLTGPAMGVGGRAGPVLNALGGAGSEAAGELAKGTPYEIPARVIGAVAGAGTGAGGMMALDRGVQIGRALATPLTAAGREALIGNTLRTQATDPNAATTALERFQLSRNAYPNAVPGFNLDAGRASMDPGLMSVADVAGANNPAARGGMVQSNNLALTQALDRQAAPLPPPEQSGATIQNTLGARRDALTTARADASGPLYEAARNNPNDLVIGPLFQHIDNAIASTKGPTQATMRQVRGLLFDSQGRPDWSPAGATAARVEVNGMLESPSLPNNTRRLLIGMRDRLDASLQSVPEAAQANATYRQMSQPLNDFSPDFGNKAVADVTERLPYGNQGYLMPAEKVASQFIKAGDLSAPSVNRALMASGNSPEVRGALASSYIEHFRDAVGNNVQRDAVGNPMMAASPAAKWLNAHEAGASRVLTPEQMASLREISDSLNAQAQQVPGRTGSPTFDRLATDSILRTALGGRFSNAPFMHPVNKALGFVYGGANQVAMNRLYEAIQDPAVAAALMRRATPGNVNMAEPVLRSIARGAALPATRDSQ